jgi:hypothetical protein
MQPLVPRTVERVNPWDLTTPAGPIFTSAAMHRVVTAWLGEIGHPVQAAAIATAPST